VHHRPAAVAPLAVSQAALGSSVVFLNPGQASLGPGTKVPSGEGARRTHSAPSLAHTHSPRVSLVRPLAHARVLGTSAVGSRLKTSLQCKHHSAFCRGAAWAHARGPDTRGSQSLPEGSSCEGLPRPRPGGWGESATFV